jgi:hypothetical protein
MPSHWAAWRSIRRLHAPGSERVESPVAVLDLSDSRVLEIAGRYLYHLVVDLEAAGYRVAFLDRLKILAGLEAKKYTRLLLHHPFLVVRGEDDLPGVHGLWFHDRRRPPHPGSGRWSPVRVRYGPRLPERAGDVPYRFGPHPLVREAGRSVSDAVARSGGQRWCRLFFAGNASPKGYSGDRLDPRHGVIPRRRVLEIAREAAGEAFQLLDPGAVVDGAYRGRHVGFGLSDTSAGRIAPADWLGVLSQADVFLAAPGVRFPFSHNVVEAMSVGAVPLLQYAHYFDPPLVPGVHCFAYRDERELRAQVQRLMTMDPSELRPMRDAVVDYYRDHLAPGRLAEAIADAAERDGQTTLLMHSFRAARPAPT